MDPAMMPAVLGARHKEKTRGLEGLVNVIWEVNQTKNSKYTAELFSKWCLLLTPAESDNDSIN